MRSNRHNNGNRIASTPLFAVVVTVLIGIALPAHAQHAETQPEWKMLIEPVSVDTWRHGKNTDAAAATIGSPIEC
jgi:hypothetical protein